MFGAYEGTRLIWANGTPYATSKRQTSPKTPNKPKRVAIAFPLIASQINDSEKTGQIYAAVFSGSRVAERFGATLRMRHGRRHFARCSLGAKLGAKPESQWCTEPDVHGHSFPKFERRADRLGL